MLEYIIQESRGNISCGLYLTIEHADKTCPMLSVSLTCAVACGTPVILERDRYLVSEQQQSLVHELFNSVQLVSINPRH